MSESAERHVSASDKVYLLELDSVYFDNKILAQLLGTTVDISESKTAKPKPARFNCSDVIELNPGDLKCVREKTVSHVGRFIFNKYIIDGSGLGEHMTYRNYRFDNKTLGALSEDVGRLLLENKIDYETMNVFISRRDALLNMLIPILNPTLTLGIMITPDVVKKRKAELLEKYKDEIAHGDVVVMKSIEVELIELAKKTLEDDTGMDLFRTGGKPEFSNNYKVNNIARGILSDKESQQYIFANASLSDGMRIEEITSSANSIIASSYAGAIGTAESGYQGKKLQALMQYCVLDEPGTDCGSLRTIDAIATDDDAKQYRYIVEGSKIIRLDESNIARYRGKKVKMRSYLGCLNDKMCNVCAGDYFYNIGITNIGLLTTKIAGVLLNLKLKQKHSLDVELTAITQDMLNNEW
jgi:hypothetical protein